MLQPPLRSTLHCSLFCCLLLPPFNNLQHPYLLFLSALLIITELQHGRWVNRASGTMLNQVTEGLTVRLALPVVPRLSDIQILCIYLFPILPTGLLLSLHACHNKIFFPCIPSSVHECKCMCLCVCTCRYRLAADTESPDVTWQVERPSLWTLAEGQKRNQIKTDIAFIKWYNATADVMCPQPLHLQYHSIIL